jgi:L-asparaginase / beta-aspartyl-peptidase
LERFTLVIDRVALPAIVVHGGAGSYLRTTTDAQRAQRGKCMLQAAAKGMKRFERAGSRGAVLAAVAVLERDQRFNAGYGSRLQRDGHARLSASIMDGERLRMSAVFNVEDCLHPSELAAALQERADRNLDGRGARVLMRELGISAVDVRSPKSIDRWRELKKSGERADREGAIGGAGAGAARRARKARLPLPADLDPGDRHGTVGAVASGLGLFACTSTGGRGHEAVGRVSDSPTAAGNYACNLVALSATGFGEQIIDLSLCSRIATRMLDGASLETALARTFAEAAARDALVGVIAVTADGQIGYAHTTEAMGVAWADSAGRTHVDEHSR